MSVVEVNPLLVRINPSSGVGSGMVGPTSSVDGNLVEFADVYGSRTRDSGISKKSVTLDTELPALNPMNFGAVNTGVATPLSSLYATLEAAQVDYPLADSLTEEVDTAAIEKMFAYMVANNYTTCYFPASRTIGGFYRLNKFIDFPYVLSAREGMLKIIGDIGSNGQLNYTSVVKRTISAAGFRAKGTSLAVNANNHLIKHIDFKDICFMGGWASFNTNSDYPLIDVDAGYELFWDNAAVSDCLGHGILFREVFDCRFNNLRVTTCGEHNGKSLSMTMTNGSANVTVSSTTGVFVGQKIYGTGLNDVYVNSITNSTTLVLSKNMTFTGSRTVCFEPKAAVHVCSNNTTNATSNNQVITGLRIESCPGAGLRIVGANNVDIWFSQCKIENALYSMDYNLDIESAVALKAEDFWLYSAPKYQNKLNFAITTAGKTLASLLSAAIDSFTLPNAYSVQTGSLTSGSAVVTGLTDTSLLTVGMNVAGTGISSGTSFLGITIASIDSPTQITLSENATATSSPSLTFAYIWNSGNFNLRQLYSGLPMIAYDAEDPRNYAFGRITNYVNTTGVLTYHVTHVFGDTSKSITSWRVTPVHPGLARLGKGSSMCGVEIVGGYASGITSDDMPYIHTFVHIDGCEGLEADIRANQGHMLLPKNSWQGQVSTSSVAIGTGTKTFTVASGLPADLVAVGNEVFASGNTTGTAENWMRGSIVSYSGTSLVINSEETQGSGTLANWKISFGRQSAYLQTGTNSGLNLRETNAVYGTPGSSANHIRGFTNDYNSNGLNGQLYAKQAVLIDAANIAWNLEKSQAANVTLGGNRTLSNPTNKKAGASYTLVVKQDGTGSRTLAYGTDYKWVGGVAPVLSTAAGAIDVLTFISDGSYMYGAIAKGFA